MSSWWSTRGVLGGLDLEENSIVARVIQAVGLFGDTLGSSDVSGSSDDEEISSSAPESTPDCPPDSVPDSCNEPESEKTETGGLAAEENTGEDKLSGKENMDDAPKNREQKNPEARVEGQRQGHVYENSETQSKEARTEGEEGRIKNAETEGEREECVEKGGGEKVHGGKLAIRAEEEVDGAENGGQEEMSMEDVEEEGGESEKKGEDEAACRGVSESWNKEAERGGGHSEEVIGPDGKEGEVVNESRSEAGRTREDQEAEREEEVGAEEDRGPGNVGEKEIQMERGEEGEGRRAGNERDSGSGVEVRREEGGVEEEDDGGTEWEKQVAVTNERGSEDDNDDLGVKEKEDEGEVEKEVEVEDLSPGGEISCCPKISSCCADISSPGGEISCCPDISSCCPETSPPGAEKTESKEKQVEKKEAVVVGREGGAEAEEDAAGQVMMERTDKVGKDCKAGEREPDISKSIKEIGEIMHTGEGTKEHGEGKEGERERGKAAGEEVKPAMERAASDSCQPSPMQQRNSDTEAPEVSADHSCVAGASNEASNCNNNTGQGSEATTCPQNVGDTGKIHSGGEEVCPASPSNDNERGDTSLSGGGSGEPAAPAPTHGSGDTQATGHSETTSPSAVVPSAPLAETTCGSGTEPDTPPSSSATPSGKVDDGVPTSPPAEQQGSVTENQQPAEPPGSAEKSKTTPSPEDKAQDIPPEKTVPQKEEVLSDCTSTPLAEKVTPMDAATGQCGTGVAPMPPPCPVTGKVTGGEEPPARAPEPRPRRGSTAAAEERPQEEAPPPSGSHKLNGETTAAAAGDDKTDGSQGEEAVSKYKTVSYRRIRRGNTKQRIDEFENKFMN